MFLTICWALLTPSRLVLTLLEIVILGWDFEVNLETERSFFELLLVFRSLRELQNLLREAFGFAISWS